ncbi:MAG: hypothetical protein ACHQT9_04760 [Candidatus Saccharimonadales bacterium]
MNEQLQQLTKQADPIIQFGKKYMTFIILIIFLVVYILLVFRIDNLSSVTPSQAEVDSKLQTIAQPKIDPKILAKVKQLQNQNIQVQTLFNQARSNPFSE